MNFIKKIYTTKKTTLQLLYSPTNVSYMLGQYLDMSADMAFPLKL